MSEKQAEDLFLKYKKKITKQLGSKEMSNTEIDRYCKKHIKKYKGSYAQDEKFPLTSGYYILNTDKSTGPGIHWVAVVITPKSAFVYDSFARDPKKLLSHFSKRLSSKKIRIISSDRKDKEELVSQSNCGQLSICWLLVCQDLGVRSACKI